MLKVKLKDWQTLEINSKIFLFNVGSLNDDLF